MTNKSETTKSILVILADIQIDYLESRRPMNTRDEAYQYLLELLDRIEAAMFQFSEDNDYTGKHARAIGILRHIANSIHSVISEVNNGIVKP